MKLTNLPTVPRKKLNSQLASTRLKKPGALPSLQRTFAKTAMQGLQRFGRQCGARAVLIVRRYLSAGKGSSQGSRDNGAADKTDSASLPSLRRD